MKPTPTEAIYGSYDQLIAEESLDLAKKVEKEYARNELVPVQCDCCGKVRFLKPGTTWYCGCCDDDDDDDSNDFPY